MLAFSFEFSVVGGLFALSVSCYSVCVPGKDDERFTLYYFLIPLFLSPATYYFLLNT